MKNQIFYVSGGGMNDAIDHWLDEGWTVKSVTPERVAITATGQSNYPKIETIKSKFIVVLEKKE
jgi:hypothetical protein